MVRSSAKTVKEYLADLPADRRKTIAAVRNVILRSLPKGYAEALNWGVISYEIPLQRYPKTYNGRPLMYAALAAQKNYAAIYLMGVYGDSSSARRLKDGFAKAGLKLDMGKSCVRFQQPEDLPLDTIGQIIASVTPEAYIAFYEAARPPRKAKPKR